MNESVRKSVGKLLECVKQAVTQTWHLIKNLENELVFLIKEMEKNIEHKHELEKFLHSPRSEKID